jgi:hypothetical protein
MFNEAPLDDELRQFYNKDLYNTSDVLDENEKEFINACSAGGKNSQD